MAPYIHYSSQGSNYSGAVAWTGLGSDVTMNGSAVGNLIIPFVVQSYVPIVHTQTINVQTVIPIYTGGFASGGSFLQAGGPQFPMIQVQGFVDTPLTEVAEDDIRTSPRNIYQGESAFIPALQVAGVPMHYTDVIAMFMEARYDGTRKDPAYFRDPYGRVYNYPRFVDLTAQGVPGAPGRYNFTFSLLINESSI